MPCGVISRANQRLCSVCWSNAGAGDESGSTAQGQQRRTHLRVVLCCARHRADALRSGTAVVEFGVHSKATAFHQRPGAILRMLPCGGQSLSLFFRLSQHRLAAAAWRVLLLRCVEPLFTQQSKGSANAVPPRTLHAHLTQRDPPPRFRLSGSGSAGGVLLVAQRLLDGAGHFDPPPRRADEADAGPQVLLCDAHADRLLEAIGAEATAGKLCSHTDTGSVAHLTRQLVEAVGVAMAQLHLCHGHLKQHSFLHTSTKRVRQSQQSMHNQRKTK